MNAFEVWLAGKVKELEAGGGGGGVEPFIVTFNDYGRPDKTAEQILAAVADGIPVIGTDFADQFLSLTSANTTCIQFLSSAIMRDDGEWHLSTFGYTYLEGEWSDFVQDFSLSERY